MSISLDGKSSPVSGDPRIAANREKVIQYLAKLAQIEEGISDILISTGCVPIVRVNGQLKRVGEKRLSLSDVEGIIDAIMPFLTGTPSKPSVTRKNLVTFKSQFLRARPRSVLRPRVPMGPTPDPAFAGRPM